MSFLLLLPHRSWLLAITVVVPGLISGAFSGSLASIGRALNMPDRLQWLPAIACARVLRSRILANSVARLLLNYFAQETIAELYRKLNPKVLATPHAQGCVFGDNRSDIYRDAILLHGKTQGHVSARPC